MLDGNFMVAQIIDGKKLATKIRAEIATQIKLKTQQGFRHPALAVILVGHDPASTIYVQRKREACDETGIASSYHHLPENISKQQLYDVIDQLNFDSNIDGILLQLPLPNSIYSDEFLEAIHPKKDVDGFHPYNVGLLAERRPALRPCTPLGIMTLLDEIHLPYKNQHAVIVGVSNIVGRPMGLELLLAGCTITMCHRFTKNLSEYVKQADILISAVGKPELIKGA